MTNLSDKHDNHDHEHIGLNTVDLQSFEKGELIKDIDIFSPDTFKGDESHYTMELICTQKYLDEFQFIFSIMDNKHQGLKSYIFFKKTKQEMFHIFQSNKTPREIIENAKKEKELDQ